MVVAFIVFQIQFSFNPCELLMSYARENLYSIKWERLKEDAECEVERNDV